MRKHYGKLIGGVLVALLVAVGVRATGYVDFTQGQMIPEALYGSHYFVPTTKTASFTLAQNEQVYYITTSGSGITATLPTPSTIATGKCWTLLLTAANGAVTLNAGTYSVNGSVTDASIDAAGDSVTVCNNGTGYQYIARYIH